MIKECFSFADRMIKNCLIPALQYVSFERKLCQGENERFLRMVTLDDTTKVVFSQSVRLKMV